MHIFSFGFFKKKITPYQSVDIGRSTNNEKFPDVPIIVLTISKQDIYHHNIFDEEIHFHEKRKVLLNQILNSKMIF